MRGNWQKISLCEIFWWRWWDSNPWPPACRAGALPTELHPHVGIMQNDEWWMQNFGWKSFAFSPSYLVSHCSLHYSFPWAFRRVSKYILHSAFCILHSLRVTQNWTTTDRYEQASSSRASKSYLFVFVSLLTIQHPASFARCHFLHRKEVIQPHLPIRLPCYDLTPIIRPTFDCCPLAVSSQASGVPNFHGLTGGVYKARERIHRGMLIRDY